MSLLNPIAIIIYFYILIYIFSPLIISLRDFNAINEVQFKLNTPVNQLLTNSLIMSTIYLGTFLLSIGKVNKIKWKNNMHQKIGIKYTLRLFILVVSIFMYVFYLLKDNLASNILDLRTGNYEAGEFLSSLVHSIAFVASGALPFIFTKNRTKKSIIIGLASLFLSYALFILIGDRSGLIYAFLIFIVIFSSVANKKVKIVDLLVYVLLIFFVLHLVTIIRNSFLTGKVLDMTFLGQNTLIDTIYDSFNLVVYEYFILVIDLHNANNYIYGGSFLNNFTGVVPRFIWPEKPTVSSAVYLSEKYYHDASRGRPFTTLGEWYINFGWIGPLIGGLIFGRLVRFIYNKYYKNFRNINTTILVTILLIMVLGNGFHSTILLQFLKFLVISYILLKLINLKF